MKFITLNILFILAACGSEPETDKTRTFNTQESFEATAKNTDDTNEDEITWIWDSTKTVQLGYQLDPKKFTKGDNQTNTLKIRLKTATESVDMKSTDTTKVQPKMTCCGYQPKQNLTFTETTSETKAQSLYFHMEGNWDIFVHVKHNGTTYKFTINTEVE